MKICDGPRNPSGVKQTLSGPVHRSTPLEKGQTKEGWTMTVRLNIALVIEALIVLGCAFVAGVAYGSRRTEIRFRSELDYVEVRIAECAAQTSAAQRFCEAALKGAKP